MPLPAGGPTSVEAVKFWRSINDDDTRDDDKLVLVVAAVNRLVRGLPVAQRFDTDPAAADWNAAEAEDVVLGATMLAARVHRRANTPGGVEVAGDFGIAYVRRNDPDVAQMLELGEYSRPAVG